MYSDFKIKEEICEIGRRIYNRGFVAANDGNITVRVDDDEIWTTPTGVSKGFLTPDMLIKVNMNGEVVSGSWKPSSELKMHLRVYKDRPDVRAVVHAHPPYATAFAIAGIPLTRCVMPEAVISLGTVPIAEYGTPSTEEIPNAIAKYLPNYDALLLENHGALTYGYDLMNAYFKMETLDFYAQLLYLANNLGGAKDISPDNVEKLMRVREKMGIKGRHPGCEGCQYADGTCKIEENQSDSQTGSKQSTVKNDDIADIVAEVTRKVMEQLR
jgi:L-fuculose-phosphate aldolase